MKHLSLKANGLTNASVDEFFASVSSLEELVLNKNFLRGVRGIGAFITANPGLRVIKLRHCYLGSEHMALIGEGLHGTQSLRELKLAYNEIEELTDLKEGLRANKSLTLLDLGNNRIYDEALEEFAEVLQFTTALEELRVHGNPV